MRSWNCFAELSRASRAWIWRWLAKDSLFQGPGGEALRPGPPDDSGRASAGLVLACWRVSVSSAPGGPAGGRGCSRPWTSGRAEGEGPVSGAFRGTPVLSAVWPSWRESSVALSDSDETEVSCGVEGSFARAAAFLVFRAVSGVSEASPERLPVAETAGKSPDVVSSSAGVAGAEASGAFPRAGRGGCGSCAGAPLAGGASGDFCGMGEESSPRVSEVMVRETANPCSVEDLLAGESCSPSEAAALWFPGSVLTCSPPSEGTGEALDARVGKVWGSEAENWGRSGRSGSQLLPESWRAASSAEVGVRRAMVSSVWVGARGGAAVSARCAAETSGAAGVSRSADETGSTGTVEISSCARAIRTESV